MAKFKVGDRVRHRTCKPEEVGEVRAAHDTGYVQTRWEGIARMMSTDHEDSLELITLSPIRTITRREIVPGVYGVVRVNDPGSKFVRINVDAPMGSDSLREAARLFNELADVLEERADEQQKEAA